MIGVFLPRVVLNNYKSIAACSVSLGPLTFLVGPNGAGKSNFLDALRTASGAAQVIVTSHSPDLLDDKSIRDDWILGVASVNGETKIGPLEEIRGAKERLSRHTAPFSPYAETTDQPALTAVFDMQEARRNADSFDKCYREIVKLLTSVGSGH